MAHQFDTGLPRAQRTVIRDGVVAVLAGLKRSNGGYLQAVIPWGGIIRGYTDEFGIGLLHAALNGRAPAIAVALGDRHLTVAGNGGFAFRGQVELLVYHYNNNVRSMADGRLAIDVVGQASNVADPGLDVAMEHAEELIAGSRPGNVPSVKQCVPIAEEEVITTAEFSLWVQRYSVGVDRVINPNRGVTELLASFRTTTRHSDEAPGDPPVTDALTTP